MSSYDKDRKVSKPTEADFIRGVADSANYARGTTSFVAGFLMSFLMGKTGKRGGNKW